MRAILALTAATFLAGCSACGSLREASARAAPTPPPPAESLFRADSPTIGDTTRIDVAGELFWLEDIALPAGASVLVEVRDVARQDTAAPLIASATYPASPGGPIPFSLELDAERIPPQAQLAVTARVSAEGRLLFLTTTRNPVPPTGARGLRIRLSPAG